MSQPTPPRQAADAWKTAAVREAESALDRSVSKSRQLLKDLEKVKLPPVDRTPSPERIAAVKAAASRPDAPPQLRLLKRKVDSGALSWEDVASGKAFADPEVRALAMGNLGEAREMYRELREGATADELIEARAGGRPADPLADTGYSPYPAAPAPPPPSEAPKEEPPARPRSESRWDDDDFADPLADDAPPRRSAPPRSTRRDAPPAADDDYFGNSPLGGG